MNKNLKNWLIAGGIITILLLPIVIPYIENKQIGVIDAKAFHDIVTNDDKTSMVYVGDLKSDNYKTIKTQLANIKKDNDIVIKILDKIKLSNNDMTDIFNKNNYNFMDDCESCYVIIRDNEIVNTVNSDITDDKLESLVKKYNENFIPDNEIAYKIADSYKTFMKAVNSKKITMAVFGYTDCGWCQKFRPIINDVASENNIDIYYFDTAVYDKDEFNKIKNSKLLIPASCTNSGEAQYLSDGYGTPLTLFTKNGKVIDCIGGYLNKTKLISKLQSVGMLEN